MKTDTLIFPFCPALHPEKCFYCHELSIILYPLIFTDKRIKFLDEVNAALGLDITTIHSRAEDGARQAGLRDSFDLVVSRAVANQSTLTEYCLPYAKIGGSFIAYKSGDIQDELKASENAIRLLGGKMKDVISMELVDSDIRRSFVIIEKIKKTPKAYPRKAGTASKSPL